MTEAEEFENVAAGALAFEAASYWTCARLIRLGELSGDVADRLAERGELTRASAFTYARATLAVIDRSTACPRLRDRVRKEWSALAMRVAREIGREGCA
jgi:hypothetical protein